MTEPGSTPSVRDLLGGYTAGTLRPETVLRETCAAIGRRGADSLWITLVPEDEALGQLEAAGPRRREGVAMPLFGVPFAIKDNIDVRRTLAGTVITTYGSEFATADTEFVRRDSGRPRPPEPDLGPHRVRLAGGQRARVAPACTRLRLAAHALSSRPARRPRRPGQALDLLPAPAGHRPCSSGPHPAAVKGTAAG